MCSQGKKQGQLGTRQGQPSTKQGQQGTKKGQGHNRTNATYLLDKLGQLLLIARAGVKWGKKMISYCKNHIIQLLFPAFHSLIVLSF